MESCKLSDFLIFVRLISQRFDSPEFLYQMFHIHYDLDYLISFLGLFEFSNVNTHHNSNTLTNGTTHVIDTELTIFEREYCKITLYT